MSMLEKLIPNIIFSLVEVKKKLDLLIEHVELFMILSIKLL